uniref:RING-type domain-containing protein n=1 Tax=Heterorhabditis bacteriophora TaxID=37862 RepID=A0A1I7XL34_HETBA
MWSTLDVFNGLLPSCAGCGASFDIRLCAPHILPCSHTFCLMCLTKEEQKRKTRCLSCKKKYTTYTFNVSFAEVVERVRQRRNWIESQSFRCDECDLRQPAFTMRRCLSCVQNISVHMSTGVEMDCTICLECCVDKHSGHEITRMAYPSLGLVTALCSTTQPLPLLSPNSLISPRGCSTPKLRTMSTSEHFSPLQIFSILPRTNGYAEDNETSASDSQHVSRWWIELVHRLFSIAKQWSNTDRDGGSKRSEKKLKKRHFSISSPESNNINLNDSV